MMQLKTKKDSSFLFQIYAPGCSYSGDEKEVFCVTLQQELNKLPRKSKLKVMGNFNGKIGKEGWSNWRNNEEKFSIGMINGNGESYYSFVPLCKHSPEHLYKWSSPNGTTQNHIDFIIVLNHQAK